MKRKTNRPTPEPEQNPDTGRLDAYTLRLPLATLAGFFDLPKTTLQDILGRANVITDGGFSLHDSARAVMNHYKAQAETESTQATKDKNAILAMQREQQAISLANEQGKLLPKDAMRRMIEGLFVSMREEIRKMDGLTLDQKKAVCLVLAKATIPEESLTE